MNCPKCGCDPRPVVVFGVEVRPCGMVPENTVIVDMDVEGCPMREPAHFQQENHE